MTHAHEALRQDAITNQKLRTAEQIAADQAFLATARTRSPRFPTINEIIRRRERRRETIVARSSLAGVLLALLYALIWHDSGYAVAAFFFVCFVVTCVVAGSRHGAYGNGTDVPQ